MVLSQQRLSLEEAVRTAIDNNPSIETIKNNMEIQELNIKSTKGDLFPTLSLSGGWSRTHTFSKGGTFIQNGIPITVGDQDTRSDNFRLSLNSGITLFDGFANYESVDLQDETYTGQKLLLEQQKSDVVISVNQKFFDVLKKEQIVRINEDNLEDSKAQLSRINEFVAVGKSIQADAYRQQVQVAQNELAVERAINDVKKAKVDLVVEMNGDINAEYDVLQGNINPDVTLDELRLILDGSQNVNALTQQAINNRYDYKSALQNIRINETALSIAEKNLYFPTVTAFGDYNLSGNSISDIHNTRVASYGLTLSYPIFQGFNLDVSKQIAEVNIKQDRDDLQKLELQIGSEIKKAVLDLQTAYKQAAILETSIESARQDKVLSEENYRVGLGTLLDVQTATINLNNLLIERSNAIYDFLIAKKFIDYYTGKLSY